MSERSRCDTVPAVSARKSTLLIGAIIAAGVALAGIGLPKCNGAGLGGTAEPGQSEPSEAPATQEPNANPRVLVQGDRCSVGDAEPASCADACAALLEARPAWVEIDGTAGTHKVVQDLRACLRESEIDVRMLSS